MANVNYLVYYLVLYLVLIRHSEPKIGHGTSALLAIRNRLPSCFMERKKETENDREREREREKDKYEELYVYTNIYTYIHVYISIYLYIYIYHLLVYNHGSKHIILTDTYISQL